MDSKGKILCCPHLFSASDRTQENYFSRIKMLMGVPEKSHFSRILFSR